ncbi:unnamed protein product [Timema podura]|uniref:Uncharacterized protein n=1 Tax=Timema podura TaxID=61482 RepID=A0ABN7P907_TIMPD|nr:unnamed protein product [Timema podura]
MARVLNDVTSSANQINFSIWLYLPLSLHYAVASRVTLRAGSSFLSTGGTVHPAAQIINHQSYKATNHDYDISLIKVYPHLRGGRVEHHFVKTPLKTPDGDSNLDHFIVGSLVYCESSALDHANTEEGDDFLHFRHKCSASSSSRGGTSGRNTGGSFRMGRHPLRFLNAI